MIGRLVRSDTAINVDVLKLAGVVVAGLLIAAAVSVEYATDWPHSLVIGLSVASLCFTGFPIIWEAIQGLVRMEVNVDELVSIAIIASMVLGEWISAASVGWIMVLGGLIEQYTSQRARRHIEMLVESGPDAALLVEDDGQVRQVKIDQLEPGHLILARPGDVIAADGLVEEGESLLDESMLTGESVPVDKMSGDRVAAGTINGNGSLKIRVERVGTESTHGKIVELVREAENHRSPILRAAESYAKWFTPLILLLATAVWLLTGEPLRAVTVLIVGCPCAFVLATPTAVVAALGRASKRGLLIKGGKYLEACAKIDVLAFDKTGTLTTGQCKIRDVVPLDGHTAESLLQHAARLEVGADHPIARAIVDKARRAGVDVAASVGIRNEPGLGISEVAKPGGSAWHIGNRRFAQHNRVEIGAEAERRAESLQQEGCGVLYVCEGRQLRGLLSVEGEIRREAAGMLTQLRAAGYNDVRILTGDTRDASLHVGEQLAVPHRSIQAELLPEDKYRLIRGMGREGRHVCYVGDGTNDGPALAVAAVGVSIASRENTVALETADVVLMSDGLSALPFLMQLGKATTRTINQNLLCFGLAFNGTMLCLSGFGLLTPILAAAGHNLGSVAVVLNSARLLRLKEAPAA